MILRYRQLPYVDIRRGCVTLRYAFYVDSCYRLAIRHAWLHAMLRDSFTAVTTTPNMSMRYAACSL